MKKSVAEWVFDIINYAFLTLLSVLTLYPIVHVLFASISDPILFAGHSGLLLKPIGFNLISYQAVFENRSIMSGYLNTIIYVTVGTTINIFLTSLGAYVLSRNGYYWKGALIFMVVFTMFFSGGLIPTFLQVQALGLKNTMGAIVFPQAVSAFNLLILRNSFAAVPVSLEESAKIDGANDFVVLWKIIIPVSKAILAVMVLFYGVSNWNRWFDAMIYLSDRTKYPLQLVLREILIANDTDEMVAGVVQDRDKISLTIQYATIVVAMAPIMCVYPLLQKHFTKGVMIGAVKG